MAPVLLESKSCQALKYLVARLPGKLGKTKLVKLLYLADLESRRLRGKPLSDMRYRWYRFGPWDEKFDECLSALRETGSIEAERYPFQGYYGSLYHNLATEEHHTLTDAEQAILDYLIQEYGQKCLKELLDDVVYETKPMKDAQERGAFNQALRMELVDNELRSGFGDVDFEELVAAEKDVQRGLSIPISEVLSGLERRNSSRGKP